MSTIGLCGRQGLFLATASTIALAMWVAAKRPEPPTVAAPRITCSARTIADISTPEGQTPDTLMMMVGTISEIDRTFHCGMFLTVTQIRYGDVFGMVVPCIETQRRLGLRFEVGDEHRLFIDGHGRVRAIDWNGHRYPIAGYPATVLTPATVIGHVISEMTFPDGEMHYRAGGWHWH